MKTNRRSFLPKSLLGAVATQLPRIPAPAVIAPLKVKTEDYETGLH